MVQSVALRNPRHTEHVANFMNTLGKGKGTGYNHNSRPKGLGDFPRRS